MSDKPRFPASSPHAFGRWERALRRLSEEKDPVADTPAWVTPGRYLAETGLADDEKARLAALPEGSPGTTDRERLNLWYLSEPGHAELLAVLRGESYRVDVPEEAALMVVAWLLDKGLAASAFDLVAELWPFLHRLRLTPRLSGGLIRLTSVGEVKESLNAVTVPPQLNAMRETLLVWHPLYDRLVALWCETVEDGWPCAVWPSGWADRRRQWLADYQVASRTHLLSGGHRRPRGNFARLRSALEVCEVDSSGLTGRDVGWVRLALADTITKHGAPGSASRAALRAHQTATVSATHLEFAAVLTGRLDRYSDHVGFASLVGDVTEDEAPALSGLPVPPNLLRKAVLAKVLPQLTSQLLAANLDAPELGALYAQTSAAYRRLLLNPEDQVRFEELPWIGALEPLRTGSANTARIAEQTLRQTTLLALSGFPQMILSNPLVREMGALAEQAGLTVPLVEEVAADIFRGGFTVEWLRAAVVTSDTMAGTLYGRYYDLPERWPAVPGATQKFGWRKRTVQEFGDVCVSRAAEARHGGSSDVAKSGTVLEQGQILTTHNLAALVDALSLQDALRGMAPELADRTLEWVVRRQLDHPRAARQMVKNVAHAWRQAIFFLSFCDQPTQDAAVGRLRELVETAGLSTRFGPAVDGLAHVVSGGRFTASGTVDGQSARRFLGWSAGPHPFLPTRRGGGA